MVTESDADDRGLVPQGPGLLAQIEAAEAASADGLAAGQIPAVSANDFMNLDLHVSAQSYTYLSNVTAASDQIIGIAGTAGGLITGTITGNTFSASLEESRTEIALRKIKETRTEQKRIEAMSDEEYRVWDQKRMKEKNPMCLVDGEDTIPFYKCTNPWDVARRGDGYSIVSKNDHSPASLVHRGDYFSQANSARSAVVSNITDFIPIFLFTVRNNRNWILEENTRQLMMTRLREPGQTGGGFSPTRCLTTGPKTSIRGEWYTTRKGLAESFHISFMFCFYYPSRRIIEPGNLVTTTQKLSPEVAWAAVVPRRYHREFILKFLNLQPIDTGALGLQFWYSEDMINRNTSLRKLFDRNVLPQAWAAGMKPLLKTKEEMRTLLTYPEQYIEKPATTIQAKKELGYAILGAAMKKLRLNQ